MGHPLHDWTDDSADGQPIVRRSAFGPKPPVCHAQLRAVTWLESRDNTWRSYCNDSAFVRLTSNLLTLLRHSHARAPPHGNVTPPGVERHLLPCVPPQYLYRRFCTPSFPPPRLCRLTVMDPLDDCRTDENRYVCFFCAGEPLAADAMKQREALGAFPFCCYGCDTRGLLHRSGWGSLSFGATSVRNSGRLRPDVG